MRYLTSDWHFFHNKMTGSNSYCSTRSHFTSVDEMNKTILDNYNKVVTNADEVYMLGDIAIHNNLSEVLDLLLQLKGTIYFVTGNHDNSKLLKYIKKNNPILKYTKKEKFRFIPMGDVIKVNGVKYYLTHYPQGLGAYRRNIMNFCGHIHEHEAHDPNVLNVGIDSCEIGSRPFGEPILLDDAIDRLEYKWVMWYEYTGKHLNRR